MTKCELSSVISIEDMLAPDERLKSFMSWIRYIVSIEQIWKAKKKKRRMYEKIEAMNMRLLIRL